MKTFRQNWLILLHVGLWVFLTAAVLMFWSRDREANDELLQKESQIAGFRKKVEAHPEIFIKYASDKDREKLLEMDSKAAIEMFAKKNQLFLANLDQSPPEIRDGRQSVKYALKFRKVSFQKVLKFVAEMSREIPGLALSELRGRRNDERDEFLDEVTVVFNEVKPEA